MGDAHPGLVRQFRVGGFNPEWVLNTLYWSNTQNGKQYPELGHPVRAPSQGGHPEWDPEPVT